MLYDGIMSVFSEYPLLIATFVGVTLLAACEQPGRPAPSQRAPTLDVSIVVNVDIYDPEEIPADEETPVLAKAPVAGQSPAALGVPVAMESPEKTDIPPAAEAPAATDIPDLGDRDRVFFGFDSTALRDDQRAMLHGWTHWLVEHPGWGLRIEGHTDAQGPCLYNRRLGQRRANVARDLLVAQGIETSRLRAVTFGEDRPLIPGASKAQRIRNRRVLAVPMSVATLKTYDPGLPPCASGDVALAVPFAGAN